MPVWILTAAVVAVIGGFAYLAVRAARTNRGGGDGRYQGDSGSSSDAGIPLWTSTDSNAGGIVSVGDDFSGGGGSSGGGGASGSWESGGDSGGDDFGGGDSGGGDSGGGGDGGGGSSD